MRDIFFYAAGLVFLALAKAKSVLLGYTSPKLIPMSEIERCVDYDRRVVDRWLDLLQEYAQDETSATVAGKDVLELGPGSDLGVGLCLLHRRANRYSACDVNDLAAHATDAFYEALFARLGQEAGAEEIESLRHELAQARAGMPSRLNYVVRDDFDFADAFGQDSIDLAFSQAAFEHFEDVDSTISRMTTVCRPGAIVVAYIDLKTHSRWIRDKDPNNIYRYSPGVYRLFAFRGVPNRLRPRDYAAILERHGWVDVSVIPGAEVPTNEVPRLHRTFTEPSCQMNLTAVIICARRPTERRD